MAEEQSQYCFVCNKPVYAMESIGCDDFRIYHKWCFKCEVCKRTLSLVNYVSIGNSIFCTNHRPKLEVRLSNDATSPGSSATQPGQSMSLHRHDNTPLRDINSPREIDGMHDSELNLDTFETLKRSLNELATHLFETHDAPDNSLNPVTSVQAISSRLPISSYIEATCMTPVIPGSIPNDFLASVGQSLSVRLINPAVNIIPNSALSYDAEAATPIIGGSASSNMTPPLLEKRLPPSSVTIDTTVRQASSSQATPNSDDDDSPKKDTASCSMDSLNDPETDDDIMCEFNQIFPHALFPGDGGQTRNQSIDMGTMGEQYVFPKERARFNSCSLTADLEVQIVNLSSKLTLKIASVSNSFDAMFQALNSSSNTLPSRDIERLLFRSLIDLLKRVLETVGWLPLIKNLVELQDSLTSLEGGIESEYADLRSVPAEKRKQMLEGMESKLTQIKGELVTTLMICESLEEQYKLFQKTIAMRPSDEYRIEIQGESAGSSSQYSNYQMEHIDESMQTYSTMFIGQEHFNYVGHTDVLGPVIISIKFESKETEGPRWRVILRQKEKKNSIHFIYEKDIVSKSVIKSKSSTVKQVLQMIHHSINPSKLVKVIDKAIEKRLKSLDEMQLSFKYKFGLLLCKDGQTREEEMFCNESSTPSFDRLISLLGNVIRLKGHSGFAGGLDVKNDQTGTLSLHSYWNKFEVMFHVSTFIPFIEGDPQQIQRKRHIGNDIVSIVFLDGGGQFDPRCITSQFLHIFIIIMEDPQYERDGVVPYRVSVASNRNVPSFGPNLPCPPLFWSKEALRHFILAKAINGENAAYSAPKFSKPHTRARNTLFDEIVTEYQAKSNSTPSSPLLKHKSGKDRDKEKDRDKDKEKDKEKDKICASVSKSRIATIEVQRPNYVVQSAKERGEPERSASVALHLESPRTKNLSRSTDLPEGSAASLRSESFNGLLGSSDGLRRRSRSLCSSDDFDRAPPDGIYSNNEPRNTSNDGAPSSKDDEGPGSRTPGETRKRFGFRVASRSKTASCTKAQPE